MADVAEAASTEPTLKPEKTIPFKDAFEANFNVAESSDLQVTCRSEIFKVHKNVLCGRSKFFENACKGGFIEATSGAIDLQDDDPDAVKAMLQFCYTADYAYDTALHAKVYATAEKYNIKSLKDLARGKFQTAAYSDWNSPYFPVTIGFVYGSTPPSDRGLRDIVVKLSKDHLKSLLARPEFESIMEEYGDFGKDLVKAIAHRPEPEPGAATYRCGGCRKLMSAWLNPNRNIYCPSCGTCYSYDAWLTWKK